MGMVRAELARLAMIHVTGLSPDTSLHDAVKALLKEFRERPGWLLLMDDVGSPEQVLDLFYQEGVLTEDVASPVELTGCLFMTTLVTVEDSRVHHVIALPNLSTDACMEILEKTDKVSHGVLNDPLVGMRDFVQRNLVNHPMTVKQFAKFLKNTDAQGVKDAMRAFRTSLQGVELLDDDRHLRGTVGTVRMLLDRMERSAMANLDAAASGDDEDEGEDCGDGHEMHTVIPTPASPEERIQLLLQAKALLCALSVMPSHDPPTQLFLDHEDFFSTDYPASHDGDLLPFGLSLFSPLGFTAAMDVLVRAGLVTRQICLPAATEGGGWLVECCCPWGLL